MNLAKTISLAFLLLDACIDPYDLNLPAEDVYVVDGEITDQPGPYTVKIFKPLTIDDQLNRLKWVRGASVSFLDENGNADALLHEISPGNYQTDSSYRGVIGKSYQLRFVTQDKEEYRSTLEKINPAGELDSLYFRFSKTESSYWFDQINTSNGFNIFINAKLAPEQEGLVRWRWKGTFGIRTYPSLKTRTSPEKGIAVPDPPACSGIDKQLVYHFACTCCYCWVTDYSTPVTLSDPKFVVNNQIQDKHITFVPASPRFMFDKYYLVVDQMSVSKVVYEFWEKVATQQIVSSDFFQTPPPSTGGNMQLISGKTPAVGIFSASAISRKTIFLTKKDVPYDVIPPIGPKDTVRESCLVAFRFSTNKKPPFW